MNNVAVSNYLQVRIKLDLRISYRSSCRVVMPCMLEKAKHLEEHIVFTLRVKELVKQETSRIRWQAELR
jgi:hypothetical protein